MMNPNKLLERLRAEQKFYRDQFKRGDILGDRKEVQLIAQGIAIAIKVVRAYQAELRCQAIRD